MTPLSKTGNENAEMSDIKLSFDIFAFSGYYIYKDSSTTKTERSFIHSFGSAQKHSKYQHGSNILSAAWYGMA